MTKLMARTALGVPTVDVRPYDGGDREGVLRMRLSLRSLYHRFFAGTPHIPAFYAGTLDRVDHQDRDAVIAVAGPEVVGIAEYTRDTALPWVADIGVVVADPWHRQGVATRLIGNLTVSARRHGITELRADVLAGNRAARAAIHGLWPRALAARGDEGTVIYRLPI
ncbi:GNAT family N-acetyltransferase [Actinoallomurus purpureus]|uniref:GNAT family N-acetyltransferase n=1 Tax=Actinoallomurus purpureus TaxID=478114 RepID=UPI002092788B|nr:GNAT family N-acetyltransferase [Actinoallomurus purpureus]MCO6010139.1 GNAT family N-acetyltransferase [Actinoallomurus purpureus]